MAGKHLTMQAPSDKQKAIPAWFDYYGAGLSNFDEFKSLMLSQSDNHVLSTTVTLNMKLNAVFAKRNSELMKAMSRESFTSQSVSLWQEKAASRKMVTNMPTAQKNNALLALLSA
jgi:hypothetical protein